MWWTGEAKRRFSWVEPLVPFQPLYPKSCPLPRCSLDHDQLAPISFGCPAALGPVLSCKKGDKFVSVFSPDPQHDLIGPATHGIRIFALPSESSNAQGQPTLSDHLTLCQPTKPFLPHHPLPFWIQLLQGTPPARTKPLHHGHIVLDPSPLPIMFDFWLSKDHFTKQPTTFAPTTSSGITVVPRSPLFSLTPLCPLTHPRCSLTIIISYLSAHPSQLSPPSLL